MAFLFCKPWLHGFCTVFARSVFSMSDYVGRCIALQSVPFFASGEQCQAQLCLHFRVGILEQFQKSRHGDGGFATDPLRAGFAVCGGHSSCITVSNLGQVSFPDAVRRELVRLDFLLTPRAHSPYNCGIASVGDTLSLTITRRGKEAGVEKRFVTGLVRRGIVPAVVEDETLTAGLPLASGAPRAGWRTRRCTGGASRRRRAAGPAPSQ